jgi:hypothetical protein
MKKFLGIIVAISAIILFLNWAVSDKESLYTSVGGTLIGFLGAFLIYQIGIMIDEKQKQKLREKNTKYIYQLYKMELEMNKNHINDLIAKKWIPFYKLKTITRDKLWGELADFSKDIELMKKLNHVYGEFELINNKIDLMIAARMANIEKSQISKSNELGQEKLQQLEGSIGLGGNALLVIDECLGILNELLNRKDDCHQPPSEASVFFKKICSWRHFFGAVIAALGTFIVFSPNLERMNAWYDSAIPCFHSLEKGMAQLTNFTISPNEEKEKALNRGDLGFDAILNVIKSMNSEKTKGLNITQITNRREIPYREPSGEYFDLFNVIHIHGPQTISPYLIVSTEAELRIWVQTYRDRWIGLVGTCGIILGIFWSYFWQLFVFVKEQVIARK